MAVPALQYTFEDHDLLSAGAKKLGTPAIQQYQLVSEQLLGFHEYTPYEAAVRSYDIALSAIAIQINYMVEAGIDAFVKSQSKRGERTTTYRAGQRRMPIVHPIAKKLAASIAPEAATASVR